MRRFPFLTLLLAATAFLPAAGPNYLHTSGAQILDSSGTPVRLTGLNWFGLETSNYCPHGLWTHSMAFYLDLVKAKGYNCLRLPYCNQLLDPGSSPNGIDLNQNADLAGLTGLQIMDKVIAGCQARGIKVILDRHRPDSQAQSALWYTAAYSESRWISDWKLLAQRYLGNDTVIGCDLHNEPHGPATWGDGTADDWVGAAERCGDAILGVNPHLLIFVEGTDAYGGSTTWWGGQLAGASAHPVRLSVPNQLVYSTHDYPASVYAQPWFSDPTYPANLPGVWDRNWGYLAKGQAAPVLIGEFGSRLATASDQQWFTALTSYIKANGLNFTFWCLNPDSGDTGGLLADDWSTVISAKQAALAPLLAPFIGGGPAPAPPPGVPAVPTGLQAVAGDGQVSLNWAASAGATSYNLYQGTVAGGEAALPVKSGLTGPSAVQTGLRNGQPYFFKVAAVNATGASALSAEVSATPAAIPPGPAPVSTAVRHPNSGPWWGESDLDLTSGARIDALTLTLYVKVTPGLTYGGMYNTVGSQIIQAHDGSAGTVSYSFSLASGTSLAAGTYTFSAQFASAGVSHATTGDSYTLVYLSGGRTQILTGTL